MATLSEYFKKDFADTFMVEKQLALTDKEGRYLGEFTARLHLQFDCNAKFVSFYVPSIEGVNCPEAIALNTIGEVLNWPATDLSIDVGFAGEIHKASELVFTGQVYVYSEGGLTEDRKQQLLREAAQVQHRLTFRDHFYMSEKNRYQIPQAFISHDSRDKLAIAEPLAKEFQKRLIPVWYDEFSLKIGDSLRESIEDGLKHAPKCILVLTPHFLKNGGWAKREYDSIFTRELIEKRNVILPIWSDVTPQDVYEFSPILADRKGVKWSLGLDEVVRQLTRVL